MKYFDVRDVIKEVPDANIYMFIGERSNGKTYSALSYALDRYCELGKTFVYVRRLAESVRAQYMRNLFWGNVKTGDVKRHLSQFGYLDIGFYSGAFWGMLENEKGKLIRDNYPIGYTQSISTWETSKGASIPHAGTIVFDEFLTRGTYWENEPILFENLISSIVRDESDVKVIMLANTVSWTCPYFREWGLGHVRNMKQGTFDVYQSGDNKRKIVVCYTEHAGPKASDVYFNYDNPRSRMITEGVWETADYPRIPPEIRDWYMGEPSYIQSIEGWTAKVQPASTPDGTECVLVFPNRREIIDREGMDPRYQDRIVYTDYFYPYPNCKFALTKHRDKYTQFLLKCFNQGAVFYYNNEVGENIRNYLKWSTKRTPIAD